MRVANKAPPERRPGAVGAVAKGDDARPRTLPDRTGPQWNAGVVLVILSASLLFPATLLVDPPAVVDSVIPNVASAPTSPPVAQPTAAEGLAPAGDARSARAQLAPTPTTAPVPMLSVLDETFGDQPDGWPNDSQSTAWFAEGAYQMAARWPDRFVAIRAPLPEPAGDDLTISASFRKIGGPPGGGYGIVVDDQAEAAGNGVDQGGRYVVAEVGDQGLVGIWRRESDHWVDLVSWTPAAAVHQGSEPNVVTVRLTGRSLSLIVNGTQAASYPDVGLAGGRVGVFVGGDGNEVELRRFLVQTPDGRVAAPAPPALAPVLVPDERAYIAYLYPRWTDAGAALKTIGSLSSVAGQAPTLLLEWTWRQQTLAATVTLRRAGSDLQSYPALASERLQPIQRLAVEIGGDVAYVADEYATLIASPDPLSDGMRHLDRAIERLHDLAPKSRRMHALLQELRRATSR